MRAGTALSDMRQLPVKSFADAFGTAPILILAPHPDDESLGCGGLIAEACCQGQPPIVVILTDGTKSHPNSRSHPPARLRALREHETREAVANLGLPPERLVFMQYIDTQAPHEGEALYKAAERVAALCSENGCSILATSWRHDPHCDHEAASIIAAHACGLSHARFLAYPIWGWTLNPDLQIDEPPVNGFQLDVGIHLAAKRAAIRAHRSQYAGIITDDPQGFQMPEHFMELFLTPTEIYLEQGHLA
jgi:LmbE family N-acetylglucosaminyl deacetylase